MEKIIIKPHNCSREEKQELIDYLEKESWDYTIKNEDDTNRCRDTFGAKG